MPKYTEIAQLVIDGQIFEDWETVSVRHALRDTPAQKFRFTCSEGMPLAKNYAKLQIKPGMRCQIILAGQLAFTGMVMSRQVFYDANHHHIEIQGQTASAVTDSVAAATKTGEFNKVTLEQVTKSLLKQVNVPYTKMGSREIPKDIFERVSIQPGQTIRSVIEGMSRQVGAILTSNVQGHFVLMAGTLPSNDQLIEGENILEGREVVWNEAYQGDYPTYNQRPGNDQQSGTKAGHENATYGLFSKTPMSQQGDQMNVSTGGDSVVTPEHPGWTKEMLNKRSTFEAGITDDDSILVTCVVQGWLRSSGQLWGPPGTMMFVKSPMLIMNRELKLSVATFTQDNQSGTRTTLELGNDRALSGGYPQMSGSGG